MTSGTTAHQPPRRRSRMNFLRVAAFFSPHLRSPVPAFLSRLAGVSLVLIAAAAGAQEPPPPAATEQSAADPVAWLLEHRELWPKEVALMEAASFPVVFNGKVAGAAEVPAGTVVQLQRIVGGNVDLNYRGGVARLPVGSTDLERRAAAAMATAQAKAAETGKPEVAAPPPESPPATSEPVSYSSAKWKVEEVAGIINRRVPVPAFAELHLTGEKNAVSSSVIDLTTPDSWLVLEKIPPSKVDSSLLSQIRVRNQTASVKNNVRVVEYGAGSVVIPHGASFEPMTVFNNEGFAGSSKPLKCYVEYDNSRLGPMKEAIRSFKLKRGYMATLAREKDGTGVSKNYVAQDHDVEIASLPPDLDRNVSFIRIFPWRWTSKKGVAGGIWQKLNVGWYYNWNITDKSTPDIEYVPIRQNRWWPGLGQDWEKMGSLHLLGYNEPDHKDQSNLSVDDAIASWPDLLRTGLRVGSPAPSDGGLGWLADFMKKADDAKLRVDFIAVHYYRAVNPRDSKAAAAQLYRFVKDLYDRYHRPIWITEWNNGANWTNAGDPTYSQQKKAIQEMIKMLDETPFVERYAIYNWVEDCRNVQRDNGSLTPAGEVYRDQQSPPGFQQVDYR